VRRFSSVWSCFFLGVFIGQPVPVTAAGSDAAGASETGREALSSRSLDEIAIELINPVGSLFSIANDFNYSSYKGRLPDSDDETKWTYEITPSFPFSLKNGKNIVLRATIPVSFGSPTYYADDDEYPEWLIRQLADTISADGVFIDGHGHLDDISYGLAYGGVSDSGFISMFGIAGVLPVSQDGSIERDQYLLGPEVAIGKITRWGVIGAWLTHLVDVADVSGRDIFWETNETSLKAFFAYGLGNGWQIISNPEITYDWEAASSNKLMLPIGGGVSKTFRAGRFPLKMDLELYSYVESPEVFGPEWLLTFSLTPVFSDRWGK